MPLAKPCFSENPLDFIIIFLAEHPPGLAGFGRLGRLAGLAGLAGWIAGLLAGKSGRLGWLRGSGGGQACLASWMSRLVGGTPEPPSLSQNYLLYSIRILAALICF